MRMACDKGTPNPAVAAQQSNPGCINQSLTTNARGTHGLGRVSEERPAPDEKHIEYNMTYAYIKV